MSESIFSAQARAQVRGVAGSCRAAPVLVDDPATLETCSTVATSNDAALISIFEAPLLYGETARDGFLRKEAELRTAFAALPVATQRALHTRFANPRVGDALATKFAGLTADRRTRLLTFLADARRREALAAAER